MKQSHIKSYKSLLFPLMLGHGFFLFTYSFQAGTYKMKTMKKKKKKKISEADRIDK